MPDISPRRLALVSRINVNVGLEVVRYVGDQSGIVESARVKLRTNQFRAVVIVLIQSSIGRI